MVKCYKRMRRRPTQTEYKGIEEASIVGVNRNRSIIYWTSSGVYWKTNIKHQVQRFSNKATLSLVHCQLYTLRHICLSELCTFLTTLYQNLLHASSFGISDRTTFAGLDISVLFHALVFVSMILNHTTCPRLLH